MVVEDYQYLPDELVSTYNMLKCAFPDGLQRDSEHYLVIIAHLLPVMSFRACALVVAYFCGNRTFTGYTNALHDGYTAANVHAKGELVTKFEEVKQRLMACDYQMWLDKGNAELGK